MDREALETAAVVPGVLTGGTSGDAGAGQELMNINKFCDDLRAELQRQRQRQKELPDEIEKLAYEIALCVLFPSPESVALEAEMEKLEEELMEIPDTIRRLSAALHDYERANCSPTAPSV